jgi:hypothetical protein
VQKWCAEQRWADGEIVTAEKKVCARLQEVVFQMRKPVPKQRGRKGKQKAQLGPQGTAFPREIILTAEDIT